MTKFLLNHRYKQVAQAQGFYDYEKKGNTLVDKYEEYLVVHPGGETEVKKRKKLLIPTPRYRTMDFRDEKAQRDFMSVLKSNGVLISNKRLAVGIDYDPAKERENVIEEEVQTALTKAEIKKGVIEQARADDLLPFVDPQILQESEDQQREEDHLHELVR